MIGVGIGSREGKPNGGGVPLASALAKGGNATGRSTLVGPVPSLSLPLLPFYVLNYFLIYLTSYLCTILNSWAALWFTIYLQQGIARMTPAVPVGEHWCPHLFNPCPSVRDF